MKKYVIGNPNNENFPFSLSFQTAFSAMKYIAEMHRFEVALEKMRLQNKSVWQLFIYRPDTRKWETPEWARAPGNLGAQSAREVLSAEFLRRQKFVNVNMK